MEDELAASIPASPSFVVFCCELDLLRLLHRKKLFHKLSASDLKAMLQSLAKEFSERSHQNESSIERLYDGIAQTQQLLVRLEGALLGTVGDSVWEALGQDVRETRAKVLDQTSDSNKAFNQELNHLTRSVERTLHNDSLASFRQSSSVTEKMIEDSLAVAIAEFLFRHKSCHLAERFCHEAQLVEQCKELKAKFSFLSKVTDSIREGSVALALDWLSQVSNDECDRLRFSLHCLAFLPLVLAGDSLKCLQYARENLSPFYATVCLSQLQQLMGTLAWKSSKIEKHPRAPQLLDVKGKTEDCVREFTSFYCQQVGMSQKCPLQAVYRPAL